MDKIIYDKYGENVDFLKLDLSYNYIKGLDPDNSIYYNIITGFVR